MESYQKETIFDSLRILDLFKELWPYIKRYPFWLTLGVSATLIHIISARFLPTLVGFLVDQAILPKDHAKFIFLALLYSGLQILYTASYFLYSLGFARLGNKALWDLRRDLLSRVQKLPMNYFHQNPSGRIVNRLTYDPANLQEFFAGDGLINVIIQFFILVSIIIAMFFISVKITFISLVFLPLFIWLSIKVTRFMRIFQRQTKEQMGNISAFATEHINGIRTLQVLNIVHESFTHFVKLTNQYKETFLKLIRAGSLLHPVLNLMTAVVISSLLISSGILNKDSSLSLGAITALLLHALDFIHPMREILERYQQFQNSLTSSERIFPILKEPQEDELFHSFFSKSGSFSQDHVSKASNFSYLLQDNSSYFHIEFKNVFFTYHSDLKPVFEDLNLGIPRGNKVGIVGRTGVGKSTIISLLQGFYVPQKGDILINQNSIRQLSLNELRRKVGVIQQDPFIFRGTLRDNITLGNFDYDDKKIESLIEKLGIKEYLNSKQMNLDFLIEERGLNLSLGEKQLINFIRLFLFNFEILVFDEASANLDSETENVLQKAWTKLSKEKTVIIIAHRLSTLKECDQIYLIQNGNIFPTTYKDIENQPDILML